MKLLYRFTAPHFCCGLLVDAVTGRVVQAAPIMGWARGKSASSVIAWARRKGYAAELVFRGTGLPAS